MLKVDQAFNGFSVNDLAVAKNFYATTPVDDIDHALDELTGKGIKFEHPAGNILSVLQVPLSP